MIYNVLGREINDKIGVKDDEGKTWKRKKKNIR